MTRLLAAILFSICLLPVARGQAKILPERITLHVENCPFDEVVHLLHERYNLSCYYSSSKVPESGIITLHAENVSLKAFLDELCRQAGISYRIKDSQVIFMVAQVDRTAPVWTLSGFVTDSATGERMIGASIVFPELKKGVSTNAFGYYSFSLPEGTYTVQCSFIGYTTVTREMDLSGNTVLSFALPGTALAIDAVRLESDRLSRAVNLKMGTDKVPEKILGVYPALMGEHDVIQFLKMMPGVQTNTDGLNGLYVRGTLPQHSTFVLDDAPMFNMYHFSGWFSTVNPDAVKEISIHKGHFPAKTGGSLGSIVDIRLKDGNNQHYHATGSVGTLTSRLTIEGPVIRNKSSFILSGRRTYIDQLLRLTESKEDRDELGRFYFYDLNGKVNFTLNHHNRFYVSGYTGKDMFWESGGTSWGNALVSARWNHLFSDKVFANMTLTGSWYDHHFKGRNQDDVVLPLTLRLRNYGFKYDFTAFTKKNIRINTGVNARYNVLPPTSVENGTFALATARIDKRSYKQLSGTVYAQAEWYLIRNWWVETGLRLVAADKIYPDDVHTRLDPEIILSTRYDLSEENSIKAAYTRNYQYYHGAPVFEVIIPFDRYLMISKKLKPQFADHFSAGFFHSQEDGGLDFSLEAYYSLLYNQYRIPISDEVYLYRDTEMDPVKGRLKTCGLEVSLRKLSGRFNGMVNYTLSDTRIHEHTLSGEMCYHPYYDRRHNLVLTLNYRLKPRILLSSNWVYMSGNPYAFPVGKYELRGRTIPLMDDNRLYNKRMPDYHRLDIGIRFELHRSVPSRHNLTISVYNVYARKNPVFYTYSDIADGNIDKNPNSGYLERNFNMMEFFFFGVFPSISYEFKFGK